MKILLITADFDEHELCTQIFNSFEEYSHHKTAHPYTLVDLYKLSFYEEEYPDESYAFNLLKYGYSVNEWNSEEVWVLDDSGEMKMGLGDI